MRAMINALLVLIGIGAAFFVALCLLLYLQQDSVLFYPGPNDSSLQAQWDSRRVEIPSDGINLEGWWAENPESSTPFTLIYFGGNAEDVLYTASSAQRFAARRMIVVNYRGYGRTPGEPSQETLYQDGLAIYDYVVNQQGTNPAQVFVIGRSLGSGVAAMLAAKRPVRGAILITPFDSIIAVASAHYPVVPVKLLLKHPFDSTRFARQASVPALLLSAEYDRVIPPIHAERLSDAWAGPKTLHVLTGVGHNEVEAHSDYFRLINEFLNSFPH